MCVRHPVGPRLSQRAAHACCQEIRLRPLVAAGWRLPSDAARSTTLVAGRGWIQPLRALSRCVSLAADRQERRYRHHDGVPQPDCRHRVLA